jgi:hypothetical protein
MPKDRRTSMDNLFEAAENDYSQRARGISSATRSVDDIGKTSARHIGSLTNDVSSLARRQREIEKQLKDIDDYKIPASKEMKAVSSSILHNVNLAMITLASGMKKITLSTAGALKEVVGDYGRAISEDFSINKQNLTAMALSRITPVFGYFVSKFMQTDVYRRAIDKIKSSFSSVFHSLMSKFGGLFHRGGGESDIDSFAKKLPKRPRKMQAGGYIAKGGLAQVHAAEVIMPIDTVLDRIDRRGGSVEIQQEMLASIQDLNIHMRTFSDSYRKDIMHRKGLVGDFIRSLISGEYGRSWEMQMLFLQKEIRNAMVDASKNTSQRMEEAMEVTMRRHPTFRNIIRFTGWTTKFAKWMMFSIPATPWRVIKWAFGKRSYYQASLDKALSADSPFSRIEAILSLIYSDVAPTLDRMAAYSYSVARNIYMLAFRAFGSKAAPPIYNPPDTFTRAGSYIKTVGGRIQKIVSVLGTPVSKLPVFSAFFSFGRKVQAKVLASRVRVIQRQIQNPDLKAISGLLGAGVVIDADFYETQDKRLKSIQEASEETADHVGETKKGFKKWFGNIWTYVLAAISILKEGLFGGLTSLITKVLGPTLGGILGPLLGKAGLLGAAGTIGWMIGTEINTWIDKAFGEKGGLGIYVFDKMQSIFGEAESAKQAWDKGELARRKAMETQEGRASNMRAITGEIEAIKDRNKFMGFDITSEADRRRINQLEILKRKYAEYGEYEESGGFFGRERTKPSNQAETLEEKLGKAKEKAQAFMNMSYEKSKELEALVKKEGGAYYNTAKLYADIYGDDAVDKFKELKETVKREGSAYLNTGQLYADISKDIGAEKIKELKERGLDIAQMAKDKVLSTIELNKGLAVDIKEGISDVGNKIGSAAASVQKTFVSTTNNSNVSSPTVNNSYGSGSGAEFMFGTGDFHAARVLQANP